MNKYRESNAALRQHQCNFQFGNSTNSLSFVFSFADWMGPFERVVCSEFNGEFNQQSFEIDRNNLEIDTQRRNVLAWVRCQNIYCNLCFDVNLWCLGFSHLLFCSQLLMNSECTANRKSSYCELNISTHSHTRNYSVVKGPTNQYLPSFTAIEH